MSTREVIGVSLSQICLVADRFRYEQRKDVKRQRTEGENLELSGAYSDMPEGRKRNLIRVLVGTALCAGLVGCIAAPLPEDLPAIAFQQAGLYRLEMALLIFYGSLLLITPAFSGVAHGRLPIEISARGAKFAEGAEWSEDLVNAKIDELEKATGALEERLLTMGNEIGQIRETTMGDRAQQGVISKR